MKQWPFIVLCLLLSLTLQSCWGLSSGLYQSGINGKNRTINVNIQQASFKGHIYFTLNQNLYVLDGNDLQRPRQLTRGIQVRDPALSPNGKWVAFTIQHQNYSDLAYMPATGGKPTIIFSGKGSYQPNGANPPQSTAHWIEEPTWTPNSQQILFLSDLQKSWNINVDAFLLDLQLYQIPIIHPHPNAAQLVAYAVYGDGGLRDPSYRPGHADEIMYTNYEYDSATGTQQVIQIELENANIVQRDLANNPYNPLYHPGANGTGNYPSVPITTGTPNVLNVEPTFSPDGNTITYVRRNDATHMSLYTMPVPNGVTGPNNDPNFNPQNPINLRNALLDYRQSRHLLTGQYLSYPTWSPDGKQIAYYAYNNSTFDLWRTTVVKNSKNNSYSLQPGSEVQLTMANGNLDANSRPCWAS